jgi:hypothetical protein
VYLYFFVVYFINDPAAKGARLRTTLLFVASTGKLFCPIVKSGRPNQFAKMTRKFINFFKKLRAKFKRETRPKT